MNGKARMGKALAKKLCAALGKNGGLYFAFFAAASVLTALVYGDSASNIIPYLVTPYTTVPAFSSMLCAAFGFTVMVLLVSVLAAQKDRGFFSTSMGIRLLVFVLNIIPIAVFRDGLSPALGWTALYFAPICFLLLWLLEMARPFLLRKIGNSRPGAALLKIGTELLPFLCAALAAYFCMPQKYRGVTWRTIDLSGTAEYLSYIVYIIFFNCISFFTVEYAISHVKEESKKNYVKHYFRYHSNAFLRFWYLLRTALPQLLGKIRKNICWLVFFVITVESIFEPVNTIGFNLINAYNNDSVAVIQNMFCIFMVMAVINIVFDVLLALLEKKEKHSGNASVIKTDSPHIASAFIPSRKTLLIAASFVIVFAGLFAAAYKEYPIAGYYDFEANAQKTVADIVEQYQLEVSPEAQSALDQKLCEKASDQSGFFLTELDMITWDGKSAKIVPFYEKTDRRFYFIAENANQQKEPLSGTIAQAQKTRRYSLASRLPLVGTSSTTFRLQADTSKSTFSEKPLFLVIPFYVLYFMAMLAVVCIVTFFFYTAAVSRYVQTAYCGKGASPFAALLSKGHEYLLAFLNASTLIIIFMLVNLFIQRHSVQQWQWVNSTFTWNLGMFCLVQVVITWMFGDTYVQDIRLHAKKLFTSQEFNYYRRIGVDPKEQCEIYHKKYGIRFFAKSFIQNMLFVANINYFIAYAFNVWTQVSDNIGLTYAISFENIFTKIVHFGQGHTSWGNYMFPIVFYGVLFAAYAYLQKKQEKAG